MLDLIEALYARFAEDDIVGAQADVWTRLNPDNPEALTKPRVVIQLPQPVDTSGLHGAAADTVLPVKIWGFGANMQEAVIALADRIDLLMLDRLTTAGGGFTLRPGAEGWQDVPDTNVSTIHLQNRYVARHWSGARVEWLANPTT